MNSPIRRLGTVVALMFLSLLISTTYVQFVDVNSLKAQPGNSRERTRELSRQRGPILVGQTAIAESVPVDDQYKYQRRYPFGAKYATVTGYFGTAPGVGPYGVEALENSYLSGSSGQLFYKRIGDLLTGEEPAGASVQLTINAKAQDAAWDALGDQRGAVVALNPKTGDILALVSKPTYNPNSLATHDAQKAKDALKALNTSDSDPLLDRAIQGDLYPPGSTFKLVTAAAAISSGQYDKNTLVDGPASIVLPGTRTALANDDDQACGPGGKVSLADALKISCNTAFANVGIDVGASALDDQAKKFGFSQSLSVPLTVTPSSFPGDADPAQTGQSAIGQYEVRVTPLQMAMVAAGIANDGVVMSPNLIRKVQTTDLATVYEPKPVELGEAVTPDVAEQLTQMMELVVQSGTGTRAQIDKVLVAGKTGTAQHQKGAPPHAWFTAFAPADDPQVAVAVVVEDGGKLGDEAFGGTVAAPIAKQVMEAVLNK